MKRKDTGKLGESLAQNHLKKNKYRILETNYRCPSGEIDIIARHSGCLVFVEVRTKTTNKFGTPEESITQSKKEHFEKTIAHYLQAHGDPASNWRMDLVAVEMDSDSKLKRMEIIENAFE